MKKKRISVSAAKSKGRNLQKLVCQMVSDLTGIPWGVDELISSRPMGQSGVDVALIGKARKLCPLSIEAKRQESFSIPAWVRQAQENQLPETAWVLVAKRSREKPIAILDLDEFFNLLSQIDNIKTLNSKEKV